MNASRPLAEPVDDGLLDHLVEECGLSQDAAAQIREIARTERVRWGDAAALSGLLTPEQLEQAIKYTTQRAMDGDGVIATALHRSMGQLVARPRFDGPELQPGPQLLFAHDPYNERSEKLRALRTELLLLSNSATLTLAVVGSGAAEGRSVLAAELALAFGQLGRRTLLVDADMRNPKQHQLFGTSNDVGLAQSIDDRNGGRVYKVAGFPSMGLLTAGTPPANPLELLSDLRFERLTNSWRKQYEFVVLDTPPISKYADGLTVATHAGRVLVVGRAETTRFKELKQMLRRLALTRAQVLGAVINEF